MTKYDNIFNRDFYPTPNHVIDLMELDIQGKTILESSAGKGNIIDYLQQNGAKKVLFCEINKDLAKICESKATQLEFDFLKLTADKVGSVDLIVMNPPFSEFKKHILHVWNIAPDGCEIVSLCNNDSVNGYQFTQTELGSIIKNYGYSQNLGNVFGINAERKTECEIGLVRLHKPKRADNLDFDEYFDSVDDIDLPASEGIVKYDEIQAMVNHYKGIAKNVGSLMQQARDFKALCGGSVSIDFKTGYSEIALTEDDFLRSIQMQKWNEIFRKLKVEKYTTSKVKENISNWVLNKSKTPFTRRNIFKMIQVIIGTKDNAIKQALEEVVDNFTKHTHENRFNVEGWKTNSGYCLNKKFIINGIQSTFSFGLDHHSRGMIQVSDLQKVLSNITGVNNELPLGHKSYYEQHSSKLCFGALRDWEIGVWHDSTFFEWKTFKKGSMHIKFKDLKHWEELNRQYAKIKGNILPNNL
jgi:hypothetical protein